MNLRAQIEAAIARRQDRHVQFLSDLIARPSLRGQEREAQARVAGHWHEQGLKVHEISCRADQDGVNLAARQCGTNPERCRSLILNAHCDVTPIDDIDRWQTPPFTGVVDGTLMRGRGALDDKAGLAVISLVAEVLNKDFRHPIGGDLILQSVVEDETTGYGSRALIAAGWSADGVIICDGTWPERIISGHLGQVWLDVLIRGEPVAASVARRGVNPIHLAQKLIGALDDFIADRNRELPSYAGIENPFLLNVGALHSGVWAGSVPARAELKIQISFPPPSLPDGMIEAARTIAATISDRIDIRPGLLQVPPFATHADCPLITDLRTVIQRQTERPVLLVTVTGHCDMRYFNTPNVCLYGPGGGKNPHGIDEYYHLEHLPLVAANIAEFAVNWCNGFR